MGHACKLLLDTDDTIGQIYVQSGFNNLANFNRLFRKYRSCTPGEYRKRYLEKMEFDWTKQITPWQFLPPGTRMAESLNPQFASARITHN